MAEFVRCKDCNGKKLVAPLGFIEKDCDTCNGAGWVREDEELHVDMMAGQPVDMMIAAKVSKARGRPRKAK